MRSERLFLITPRVIRENDVSRPLPTAVPALQPPASAPPPAEPARVYQRPHSSEQY